MGQRQSLQLLQSAVVPGYSGYSLRVLVPAEAISRELFCLDRCHHRSSFLFRCPAEVLVAPLLGGVFTLAATLS